MNGTSAPSAFGQGNLYASTTTREADLGATMVTRDGREFVYVKNGAVLLVAGNMLQAPAQVTTHQQLVPAAAAIGARTITVTLGATNNAAANQYAGGWAIIDTTPGLGYAYPIESHPAAVATATMVLKLPADATVQVALTTTSRVSLVPNRYNGVIQTPVTTLTGAVVGAAVHPIEASSYGWIQTDGPCGVLIDGTPAVGQSVSCPAAAAGAVAINSGTLQIVGTMMVTGVTGKVQGVMLNIK